LFDTRDVAGITSPDYPGERLVVCKNPLLAGERTRKRSALVEATEAALKRIQARVAREKNPRRGAAVIMLLHADHDEDAFALRGQIRDDIAALPNASMYVWYEQGGNSQLSVQGVFPGRMDISQVQLPDNASYHLCGPVPFMQAIRSALIKRGVEPRDIQYEVFGPDLWQADYE
jgi:hypothetical protein